MGRAGGRVRGMSGPGKGSVGTGQRARSQETRPYGRLWSTEPRTQLCTQRPPGRPDSHGTRQDSVATWPHPREEGQNPPGSSQTLDLGDFQTVLNKLQEREDKDPHYRKVPGEARWSQRPVRGLQDGPVRARSASKRPQRAPGTAGEKP